MSFPDFTGNPLAFVELGDGGAHSPQIKFTAPDNSCIWNGFPVCITNPPPRDCSGFIAQNSDGLELGNFLTTPGAGTSFPTHGVWPPALVYGYLQGILCGLQLQARITFNAHGTTSVGSVGVFNAVSGGSCGAKAGPILGDYDSDWFDISCEDCTLAGDDLTLVLGFTNFNPVPPAQVQIDNGALRVRWFATGDPEVGEFEPLFPYSIVYHNPCYEPVGSEDLGPGLYINLPSDSCGNLYKTYQDINIDIFNMGLDVTATVLGGHGSDIARADPDCAEFPYCCDMAGAICSGGVDTDEGGGGGAG